MPKEKIAIFLGAGFSKWAASLPLANELFDFNITQDRDRKRENEKIDSLKKLKKQWDNDNFDGHAEEFITDCLSNKYPGVVVCNRYKRDKKRIRTDLSWYITRRLSNSFFKYEKPVRRRDFHSVPYYKRRPIPFDQPDRFENIGILKSKSFFELFDHEKIIGIITTNYDTLVEHSLGCDGFNYGVYGEVLKGIKELYPNELSTNKPILTGNLSLAKIHGSISWNINDRFADCSPGLNGNALIVPPTINKNQYYSKMDDVWALAQTILTKVDSLIVFGFSFNPIDQAVIELLGDSDPNNILLINPDSKINEAARIWKEAEIENITPTDDLDLLKSWRDV